MDKNVADNKSNEPKIGSSKMPKWIVFLLSIFGLIYLLNPTGGMIELIPDFAPIVGNLDEGVAAVLVWQGLQLLFNRKKS